MLNAPADDLLVNVVYIRNNVILNITAPRLNRLIAAGEFPGPVRSIGRDRQWRLADLRAYLDGKTSGFMRFRRRNGNCE
jgi:hypothetical protein